MVRDQLHQCQESFNLLYNTMTEYRWVCSRTPTDWINMSEWMTGFLTGFGVLHVLMMVILSAYFAKERAFRSPRKNRAKTWTAGVLVIVFWEIAFGISLLTEDKQRR